MTRSPIEGGRRIAAMGHTRAAFIALGIALALGGCTTASSSTSQDAGSDVSATPDLGVDVGALDRPATDVPRPNDVVAVTDVVDVADVIDVADVVDVADARDVVDVAVVADVADVPSIDAGRCDPAAGCHAFWCGCGRCDPSTITCTPDARGCPLACASACPELDTAVCACSGGTCGAPVLADAGSDAGADAGGLAAGEPCSGDEVCATGLLCCYPCGIPGCVNRCGAPDPHTGRCPLLP